MDGQSAPASSATYPNVSSGDPQSPDPYSTRPPYGGTQSPSTVPVAGQGETDISSPRIQDRIQDRMQARVPPLPATPPPPTEFQRVVAVRTGRMVPIFGAGLFPPPPSDR